MQYTSVMAGSRRPHFNVTVLHSALEFEPFPRIFTKRKLHLPLCSELQIQTRWRHCQGSVWNFAFRTSNPNTLKALSRACLERKIFSEIIHESSLSKGNLAVGFESMLGARIHGSELGAEIHGSEVGATDLGAELGAKICGSELLATSTPPRMPWCAWPGTSDPRSVAPRHVTSEPWVLAPTLRVQRRVYVSQGAKRKFSSKKRPNCKKLGFK